MFEKIKLYGIKTSLKYGFCELRYLTRNIFFNSYSQEGEDLIIDKLLGYKEKGFYIDVGAFDPARFSNTKRFYLRGWRGINIEPNPIKYCLFLKDRPLDINLNLGIADRQGKMVYYILYPETLSTFCLDEIKRRKKEGIRFKVIKKVNIKVDTLANVVEKYAKERKIDFVSIDTEGFDLRVLKSNNWEKYRPRLICIEKDPQGQGEVDLFLKKRGYDLCFKGRVNNIYQDVLL
jgi:FkbM family methyltransferase